MNNNIIIFIPCYNRKKYIEDSLKSVVNQDYENKQIIVVDDHSDDGSYELLEKLKKKWDFTLLKTDKPKRGTYWISNMIMKNYESELYQVLDSDDVLIPGSTRELIEFMNEENADIIGGQHYIINEKGEALTKHSRWQPYDANYAFQIRRGAYVNRSGMIWKKEVIEKIGNFNDSTICTSDYEFALKALSNGIIIRNIKKYIVNYRMHKKSLSNSYRYGIVNQERVNNINRIELKHPFFYNMKSKYLTFFESELKYFVNIERRKVELWCLEYIALFIKNKKSYNVEQANILLNQIKYCDEEKSDIQFLINLNLKKKKEALKYYNKERNNSELQWSYFIASVCKEINEEKYSIQIFNEMLKTELNSDMESGIRFHFGEINYKKQNYKKAAIEFTKCLQLNKYHKKANLYLININKHKGGNI